MSKSTCPCEQIYASATSNGSASTISGDLVTANATATASSAVSYTEALSIATKDAKQLANNYAQHDADVIDQTLTIINSRSLIPSTAGITVGSKTAPYSQVYTAKGVVLSSNSIGNEVILTSSQSKLYANGAQVYTSANPPGTLGNSFTFFGVNAGNPVQDQMTGYSVSGFGCNTLTLLTSGHSNSASGAFTLQSTTTGSENTAIGAGALQFNNTGNNNTSIGCRSLAINNTSSYNTAIGFQADIANDTLTNCTSVGNNAICTASNQITLGNTVVSVLRCNATSITALSDRRDKKDIVNLESSLEFIEQLKPVRFNWNMRDGGKVDIPEIGFLAQDLQQVQQDTGITIPNLVYAVNPEKLEASYGTLLPLLVKSIQELSQDNKRLHAQIQELTAKITK